MLIECAHDWLRRLYFSILPYRYKNFDENVYRLELLSLSSFAQMGLKPETALAVCNLFQYSAMMADKAAGANYNNYLNLCRGDKVKVVSFMARISSVSSLVTFVLGPWIGELSDTLGRKPVLVGTQMIMAVCGIGGMRSSIRRSMWRSHSCSQ